MSGQVQARARRWARGTCIRVGQRPGGGDNSETEGRNGGGGWGDPPGGGGRKEQRNRALTSVGSQAVPQPSLSLVPWRPHLENGDKRSGHLLGGCWALVKWCA